MSSEFKIEEIKSDGFLHSRIYEFIYEPQNKLFKVNLGFGDLKEGGAVVDCTITITDWWDLEVIEKGKNVFKRYLNEEIPTDTDQIIKYEYAENILTLKTYGSLSIDSVLYYIFTKPKIKITGEYDPD